MTIQLYSSAAAIALFGLSLASPCFADTDYVELRGNSAAQARIAGNLGMADSYRQHWNTTTETNCQGVNIGTAPGAGAATGNFGPANAFGRMPNTVVRPGLGGSTTIVTGAINNICATN